MDFLSEQRAMPVDNRSPAAETEGCSAAVSQCPARGIPAIARWPGMAYRCRCGHSIPRYGSTLRQRPFPPSRQRDSDPRVVCQNLQYRPAAPADRPPTVAAVPLPPGDRIDGLIEKFPQKTTFLRAHFADLGVNVFHYSVLLVGCRMTVFIRSGLHRRTSLR